MESNYKQIVEKYTTEVKVDNALAQRLNRFVNNFINKDEDHINFFGSNLTGVYSIYFTTLDKNELMIDVIGNVNDGAIRREIKALPYVGSTWVVATEPVTVVCIYLAYRFYNSTLPQKVKEQAMLDCAMIVHFKFITSLMNHYFQYNIPMATALASYSALSRKFTLKDEGTWYKTLKRRCEDFLFNQDSWHEQIHTFEPDEELIKMFSDLQVRMRSMVKNIAEVTYRLHSAGIGVDSESSTVETDDGLKVRDVQRLHSVYKDYLMATVVEPRALIKSELVHIIGEAITTMPEGPVFQILTYLSELVRTNDRNAYKLIDETMMFLFNYLQREGKQDNSLSNITLLLEKLKNLLTASKTKDHTILELRRLSEKVVLKGSPIRNKAAVSGLKTGLILYLILRAITKHHYSG